VSNDFVVVDHWVVDGGSVGFGQPWLYMGLEMEWNVLWFYGSWTTTVLWWVFVGVWAFGYDVGLQMVGDEGMNSGDSGLDVGLQMAGGDREGMSSVGNGLDSNFLWDQLIR
jgi:hypothetical protein